MGVFRKYLLNILLSAGSILFVLLVLELGFRIYSRDFTVSNYLITHQNLLRSAFPCQPDANLGWIPRVGASGKRNEWGTTVTIGENGIRSNGGTLIPEENLNRQPILAVGDSFAFGDGVSDDETWPSYLESFLGREVLNGGVFGYGLDQTIIRANNLSQIYHPEILIVSLIHEDVYRCQLSERGGVQKPYFIFEGDNLVEKNTPVPLPVPSHIDPLRRILGYSVFIDWLMRSTWPRYWFEGYHRSTQAHKEGPKVSCVLLHGLEELAAANQIKKVYLLIQYARNDEEDPEIRKISEFVRRCADSPLIRVVDLGDPLLKIKKSDPKLYQKYITHHMTKDGNRFVAEQLYQVMRQSEEETRWP